MVVRPCIARLGAVHNIRAKFECLSKRVTVAFVVSVCYGLSCSPTRQPPLVDTSGIEWLVIWDFDGGSRWLKVLTKHVSVVANLAR